MPWVEFLTDFNWDPPERGGRVTIAYRAGHVCNVRRICATAALQAGAAKLVSPKEANHDH